MLELIFLPLTLGLSFSLMESATCAMVGCNLSLIGTAQKHTDLHHCSLMQGGHS